MIYPAFAPAPWDVPGRSAFLLRRFDPHEMADLADHAAHRRRVGDFAAAVHLVEAEADQRVALTRLAADRAADLGDLQFTGHLRLVLLARVGFSAALAADDLADLLAAACRDRTRRVAAGQGIERRLDHVVRVRGADRLRHHVVDAERLADRAHRAAGDDAGAGVRRPHHHVAGAVMADHIVVQGPTLTQRHADHLPLGMLGRLADRLGHFTRLAGTVTDAALAVADHHDRREAEALAALHHLGDAVDADQLLDQLGLGVTVALPLPIAAAPLSLFTLSHKLHPSWNGA